MSEIRCKYEISYTRAATDYKINHFVIVAGDFSAHTEALSKRTLPVCSVMWAVTGCSVRRKRFVVEVSWRSPKVADRRRPGNKFTPGMSTCHFLGLPLALFV